MNKETLEQIGTWSREGYIDVIGRRYEREGASPEKARELAALGWEMAGDYLRENVGAIEHLAIDRATAVFDYHADLIAQGTSADVLAEHIQRTREIYPELVFDDHQAELEDGMGDYVEPRRVEEFLKTPNTDQHEPSGLIDPEILAEQRAIEQAEAIGIAQFAAASDDYGRRISDAYTPAQLAEDYRVRDGAITAERMAAGRAIFDAMESGQNSFMAADKALVEMGILTEGAPKFLSDALDYVARAFVASGERSPDEADTIITVSLAVAELVESGRPSPLVCEPSLLVCEEICEALGVDPDPRDLLHESDTMDNDELQDLAARAGLPPREDDALRTFAREAMGEPSTRIWEQEDGPTYQIADHARAAIEELAALVPHAERQPLHRGEQEPTEAEITRHMMTGEEPAQPAPEKAQSSREGLSFLTRAAGRAVTEIKAERGGYRFADKDVSKDFAAVAGGAAKGQGRDRERVRERDDEPPRDPSGGAAAMRATPRTLSEIKAEREASGRGATERAASQKAAEAFDRVSRSSHRDGPDLGR